MGWFGGIWLISPSISYPFQRQSSMSLDIDTSFIFRDRVDIGVRGRIYGDRMEELTEQELLYHYPLRAHTLARFRLGTGQESIVLRVGWRHRMNTSKLMRMIYTEQNKDTLGVG